MEFDKPIQWPARSFEFYKQVRILSPQLVSGTILAIDPSSGGTSQPGYAVFSAGELIRSGELAIPSSRNINERLQILHHQIWSLTNYRPDILAIEEVSKGTMAHPFLKLAVGATIAAGQANAWIEVPINVWKAVAKAIPQYRKTNTSDAELIGLCLVMLAKEHLSSLEEARKK